MDYIGNNIRRERVKARLNQYELARSLDIGQAAISRYENGARRPSIKILKKMAAVLGCSFTTLVNEGNDLIGSFSKSINLMNNMNDFDELFIMKMISFNPELSERLSSLSMRGKEMTSEDWQFLVNNILYVINEMEMMLDRKQQD